MPITHKTSLLQDKTIAIIGAGPGGLTLAKLLQMKGAIVKVYERDHSQAARVQGAIVDLHFDSGLKVIEIAGLTDAFKRTYMPGADKFRLVNPDGNILLDDGDQNGKISFGHRNFRPEIDRGALRDLLIDSLLPDTVVWDSQFMGMAQAGEGWQLEFKNGTMATADLVIGADGYRSKIRPYLTDVKPLYSGATIIQGEIDDPESACPEMYNLVDNGNLMAMGRGKTIVAQPRGDGGLTFYSISMYPEDWPQKSGINFNNTVEVYNYLLHFYDGWNPVFYTLFKACNRYVPRPLNYFPLQHRWQTKANITLLGDAAHLMPPNGEGVNLAMLDALDLSECLTNDEHTSLQQAIESYEDMMFTRAGSLSKETVETIEDFASPSDESIQRMVQILSGANSATE